MQSAHASPLPARSLSPAPAGDGPITLVTGGAGFIGSHLVDRLLADGRQVRVLDDFSTGREANLAHLAGEPRLTVTRGSILDRSVVAEAMRGAEAVFHLAAVVGVQHVVDNPLKMLITNAEGTQVVLDAAMAAGARVLLASTSEVYGQSEAIPFAEDGPRVLGPTWIHRWGYATAKALDEHLAFAYADRGLAMSIVRYFNAYGPRLDPSGYGSVIARFIAQAQAGQPLTVHGDGEQTRCFTYVAEAVEATFRAGSSPDALGQAFNIGSGFEHSINDLAARVLTATGSRSPIVHLPYEAAYGARFADTRRRVPDVALIERVLGWRADVGLDEGMARVLQG